MRKRGDEMKNEYIKKLTDFAMQITKLKEDPLDGDQTEVLAEMFSIELDFQNGNITSKEYNERYSKLNMEIL